MATSLPGRKSVGGATSPRRNMATSLSGRTSVGGATSAGGNVRASLSGRKFGRGTTSPTSLLVADVAGAAALDRFRGRDGQGSPRFNSINHLHVALDKALTLARARKLPEEVEELDACVTFKEAVDAGLLSHKRLQEYRAELGKESRTPGERGDIMSVWDLCELVSRPTFAFADVDDKLGSSDGESDISSCENGGRRDKEEMDDAEIGLASSSLEPSSNLQEGTSKLKRNVQKVQMVAALASKMRANEGDSSPPDTIKSLGEPAVGRTREPTLTIEGTWELGKCDGTDTAQNPQVQLQVERLTWMSVELVADGPCGKTTQLWLLGKSRWGIRRHKLVHVIAQASKHGDSWGPRHVKCECELRADEVITIVVACTGGDDRRGKEQKRSLYEAERESGTARVGSKDRTHRSSIGAQPDITSRTAFHASQRASSKESIQNDEEEVPTFRLNIITNRPLARGPELLTQRLKREEVEHRCSDAAFKNLPKLQSPVDTYTSEGHSPTQSRRSSAILATRTPREASQVEICPEKIPIFAKAYLDKGDGLEERVERLVVDASAECCRRRRIIATAEVKQALETYGQGENQAYSGLSPADLAKIRNAQKINKVWYFRRRLEGSPLAGRHGS